MNENLLFVAIDLAGYGRNVLGADWGKNPRDVIVAGYSDVVLSMITQLQSSQAQVIKDYCSNI